MAVLHDFERCLCCCWMIVPLELESAVVDVDPILKDPAAAVKGLGCCSACCTLLIDDVGFSNGCCCCVGCLCLRILDGVVFKAIVVEVWLFVDGREEQPWHGGEETHGRL